MKILVVEDEFSLADIIKDRLTREKYIVDVRYNGEDGLDEALTDLYDLIILDVMLPKINGFDILKELRENELKSKIIMLTAKSELEDKLIGLTGGADDYVTKPFHIEELVARVNILLRKENKKVNCTYIECFDLKLDITKSKLICTKTKEEVEVMKKEFYLLEYLMRNKEQILSKDQILDRIWGLENTIESNNIEAYMSFLRKKLKVIGSNTIIKAVRGLGYKMEELK